MVIVSQNSRNDSARAVSRGGDNTSARSVFFVNRQCKHVYPVDHVHRVVRQFIAGNQHTTQCGGAARHTQWARQHAFGIHAAIDTGTHGLPDVSKILFDFFTAVQSQLVLHNHARKGHACLFTMVEHLFGGIE
ncbi:hypothetical protein D3C75_914670 [compost metagenome]